VTEGLGSGFLVDDQGHILTNNHVVAGASSVEVALSHGKTVSARVLGTDPADDLALIKVDPAAVAGIVPLPLGDSSAVKPGQMAIALGSPYGLTDSITVGVISGLNRNLGGPGMTGMLQTDASIGPGNSGGPLLNSRGEVIGINTAGQSSPETGANIGFAVPSNVARRVLPDLIAGRQVTRPWLGITGAPVTETLKQNLGLSTDSGIYVVAVVSGSPAEKAGLQASGSHANSMPAAGGDTITSVDGKMLSDVTDLSNYLNGKRVGETVMLTVVRNGQSREVQLTLGAWPDRVLSDSSPDVTPQPRLPGGRSGG
jgi:S1-C subfamily serine protease